MFLTEKAAAQKIKPMFFKRVSRKMGSILATGKALSPCASNPMINNFHE